MKNSHRNAIILILAIGFLAFNFIGEKTAAQIRAAKSTPTPKTKKSATPNSKTTPKPTPKPTPKATPKPSPSKPTKIPVKSNTAAKTSKTAAPIKNKTAPIKNDKSTKTPVNSETAKTNLKPSPSKPTGAPTEVIVTATAVKVRQSPAPSSPQLTAVWLGKVLTVAEKNAAWYRVEYADGKSGWVSKTFLKDYDSTKRDAIYREIANRYGATKKLDFATASEAANFLKTARTEIKSKELQADLSYRWLKILIAALRAIPSGKGEQEPYQTFLKANEKDVVYSEPSAMWLVRSDLFWELHGKYVEFPIAEEIAWTAAQNPIPGECEGYINCYLYLLRQTDGEYLNFYPNGKYSKQALKNITNLLEPIVADAGEKEVYTAPTDISDRAEFNRFLTELRTIISKVPDLEKNKPLQQINQLGESYK